jgi:hypothetical protein
MTHSSPVIANIVDRDVMTNAKALAPKLGPNVRSLKENMASSLVCSATEASVNEDKWHTRLTSQCRARVWKVIIEADGCLIKGSVPFIKTKPTRYRLGLLELARHGADWQHQDLLT